MTTPKTPAKKPKLTHVDRTTTPFTGTLKIDATSVAAFLVDLPKGGMQGLRTPLPGIDGVVAELAVAVPADGAAAGISSTVYGQFVTRTTQIEQLQAISADAQKLAEVITETLALLEDGREQNIGQIVDAIRSTAKRSKSAGISAPFGKTLAYRAQVADKAVATRQKKKAAAAAPQATTPATPATPAPGH
jgi:hypothetical protein